MKRVVQFPKAQCRLVIAVATAFWLQSASAQLTCVTNNGAITITGFTGSSPSITIPATTNGYPVTTIGSAAFAGKSSLAEVSIPNSVTNIGDFAFLGSGLTGVTVPAGVINIGVDAFVACTTLTNISVNATNPAYSSLNGVLFDKARNTLIQYPAALTVGTYAIPWGVKTIGSDAFYEASGFSAVTIPASVSGIASEAFAYCGAQGNQYLQIYFQGNAPSLASSVFYQDGLDGFKVFYLPGTTGWNAFNSSPSPAALLPWYLPAPAILAFEPSFGVQSNHFAFTISWATNAFVLVDACTNLSAPVWLPLAGYTLTTTNGSTGFTDSQSAGLPGRFYRLRSSATQPLFVTNSGAVKITGYAGSGSAVTIPPRINGYPVTAIGAAAFAGSSLTSITIPGSVTNVGDFAFENSGLTSVTLPDSVTGIGYSAFAACTALTNIAVTVGNPAYSSLNGVLFDKSRDTLIQYPAGLVTGAYIVPSGVSTISDNAFYQASGFSTVTIPAGVISIGADAFAFCGAQQNTYLQVDFEGNAPNVGSFAFYGDGINGFVAYQLPGTTGWSDFNSAQSPAALLFWYLPNPKILICEPSFGMHAGQFGFTVSWATNATVVVDACTNPAAPVWLPVSTNTLTANVGTASFTDPSSGTFRTRFYRLRVPK